MPKTMKNLLYILIFLATTKIFAQSSEIRNDGIVVSKMNTTQRNAILNPKTGQLIYNTDENCINLYKNGTWQSLCSSVSSGSVKVINLSNTPNPSGDPLDRAGASTIFFTGNTEVAANLAIKGISGGVEGTLVTIVLDHNLACPGNNYTYSNQTPIVLTFLHNQATVSSNSIITTTLNSLVLKSGFCYWLFYDPNTFIVFPSFNDEKGASVSLIYLGGKWRILTFQT